MSAGPEQLPELLARARAGDAAAADAILPLVYDDLKRLAQWHMSRERVRGAGHTLQATALVHEVYLRLSRGRDLPWNDRKHFFAAAALAMRRILVERARRLRSQHPREGGEVLVEVPAPAPPGTPGDQPGTGPLEGEPDWEHLDSALTELERADPELAEVVHLRYFTGLSVPEIALALDLSPRTVDRRWGVARAWLLDWMARHGGEDRSLSQ